MFRNVKKEEIAIPAQMSYMGQVRDFIEHIGSKYKYPDKIINSYKLVIEEACTNIIRHGYRDIKGGEISIKAIVRRQSLTIVITDQGISYDPRQAQTPDLEKYIQIGKKGGLGIFMMRKLMDDVQYNITNRGNELRLTKQRETDDSPKGFGRWESFSMRTRYTIRTSAIMTVLALVTFFWLYSQVDKNTLDDTIEYMRAQALSLADNSKEPLQDGEDLDLFGVAQTFKTNNLGLVYETFIVDTSSKIIASSTPLKALGQYSYPEDITVIEDTLSYFRIYRYNVSDTLNIYDFVADIDAGIRGASPLVGTAHLWLSNDYIESRTSAQKINIILLIFGLLIASFVGAYFLIDRIVTPFHSLADWVRQVGQGTVDEDEIDIDASDELGEIAQAFNMMTNKFREAQVSVIEQQRLQKELQVAQEIQQMLLPSDFPQVKGYDLASFYEAAKEVGGDLFDFVEVDKDTIGICVADVAGKGVPGSLIMTMIRTALRLEARGNKNPADVLSKVNRFVTDDMRRGMFVTMFYLVLDSRKRIIHYASAGHNPMILYRGNTKQTYFLNPSGFPVGIQLPDISLFEERIEQDSIRLREDDLLVLYTDGITEAMNQKRELYREERFLEAVRQNAHYDVSDFINRVKDDIKGHTKGYPQNDDITYVAVKEKLMHGEVLFTIQKELFHLIEEKKMPVKQACEQMQVSPYMYRKYKKVKDSVGMEGLKELLYESDYIEKKHISIEVKTKLYDVISNHPEYGPKRLSQELNTEKYGPTILEENRIYNELVKSKLNTKEKRENHIKRGGKKRLKAPGTPLLTLDGQVILDYESAEQVVEEKTGVKTSPDLMVQVPEAKRRVEERKLSSKSKDEEVTDIEKTKTEEPGKTKETVEKADEVKIPIKAEKVEKEPIEKIKAEDLAAKPKIKEIKKPEKPADIVVEDEKPSADDKGKEAVEETAKKITVAEKEPSTEPAVAAKTRAKKVPSMSVEEIDKLKAQKDVLLKTLEKEKKEVAKEPKPEAIKEVLKVPTIKKAFEEDSAKLAPRPAFKAPDGQVSSQKIEQFYRYVYSEINQIKKTVESWSNGGFKKRDLLKIGKSLGVISTNPMLKSLGRIEQLFVQVIRYFEFLETHDADFNSKMIVQNSKDMLKYIEKENILRNSGRILEQINELGIKNHQIRSQIKTKDSGKPSQLDSIRKKLAKKNVIKNETILDNIAKTNKS